MSTEALQEVRTALDELALSIVMDSVPEEREQASEWVNDIAIRLGELQSAARTGGWSDAAELAGRLSREIQDGSGWDQPVHGLERGLTELRAVLERAQHADVSGEEEAAAEVPAAEAPAAVPAPPASAAASERPSELVLGAMAEDRELLGDFVNESRDHLAAIETGLLDLEQNPAKGEVIHAIFRGFHTIKGLAGFLELNEIRDISHEVETLLGMAREGTFEITPDAVDVMLESADLLNQWVRALENRLAGRPAQIPASSAPLVAKVLALRDGTAPAAAPATPMMEAPQAEAATSAPAQAAPVEAASSAPAPEPGREKPVASNDKHGAAGEHRSVKVHTGKLDYLVDMVGELVIAQSLVRHDPDLALNQKPRLAHNLSQLSRITDEVQRTAMSMRMVQVGPLFQKMGRLVRDLSRKSSKQAELEMSGESTELDRTIVEQLADPLMHMVRNSVDHGLEMPDERLAAGKSPVGKVMLGARHESGQIVIDVADDGRGLDARKILAKARRNGLVPEGVTPSEQEIFGLIFQPGFSTAEQVTDVSGRGVGMDVVKRNVQKLRGRIEIHSTLGKGTTFQIKLPLTLAIIDGLVVGVGDQRYIVPVFSVKEIVHATPETLATVENRYEMAQVRGQLIPVLRLAQRFGVAATRQDGGGLLIVTSSSERRFGLMVDHLIGKQEVVIKSLGDTFKHVTGLAGGAILGDGRVGLILDLETLYGGGTNGSAV